MKIMHMLGVLVLVAALALLALGGVGYNGQRGLLEAIAAQVTSSDALRNHMQADMMHDALRGDVTAGLLAAARQDDAGITEAHTSLGEHATEFRQAVEANRKLPLEPALRNDLEAVTPALQAYIASAEQVMSLAQHHADSNVAYADFTDKFGQLETRMGAISERILALNEANRSQAEQYSHRVMWQQGSAMVLAFVCLALAAGWILRSVFGLLGGEPQLAMAAAQHIAEGRLDQPIPVAAQHAHSLMAALSRMQRDLRERLEHERRIAAENLRIRTALDNASTGMYIADPDLTIIYTNAALQSLVHTYADDIQPAHPRSIALPTSLGNRSRCWKWATRRTRKSTSVSTAKVPRNARCSTAQPASRKTSRQSATNAVRTWALSASGAIAPPKRGWKWTWPMWCAAQPRAICPGASTAAENRAFSCNWRNNSMRCSTPTQ
ncbi:MCP four helix bundle domain-containing protein [Xanthomonas vesicatoria]|uniref:MCP four helix bundle domain-containing protein n=1 Tax=Xanthomonas vesicatoria TaxID=56460 RepID=A0ABS8L746_9XANT|nr:MCP four helix bundle domain-containing protein [Xanthomonas vesicatoria]MCC8600147.1 MCP four helix bundle domain-containing protein [Xanthomonas vesicatoria]MCC8608681.1 MCP four helix bundle domain-containing protein [Xanthomonas vesicatoria]MCC8621569.1 MCP four helix bundle domain-containing protein [Xanthomonas vesicatoria]MCC8672129.1 MCP four helix bundle domain-containing protein [Xanthomonas vesicatoria]